jgi:histidine triad (HIT) family protein
MVERFYKVWFMGYVMEECVFCKIVAGEISADKVWEDDNHVAILDINPYVKGHVMIIPKEHSRWVWDIEDEAYCEYMIAVKKVALILKKAFDTDSIQEVIAGFGVAHTHIHLLPRTKDDGLGEILNKPLENKLTDEEMKEIFDKIKRAVDD